MATQLTLPSRNPMRFARDDSSRPKALPDLAGAERRENDPGPLVSEVRSVLRVAATIGAIALSAYAVIFVVALLALLGGP